MPQRLWTILWSWPPRLVGRFWRIIAHTDPENAAIWLGIYAIAWGLALLNPHQTFLNSPSFVWLASQASEDVWGVVAIICGFAQILCVLAFGWRMLALMGAVDCLWWLFLAIGMALSYSSPVPTYLFVVFSAKGLWVFLNVVLWRPRR
jgi:hypothetical protein